MNSLIGSGQASAINMQQAHIPSVGSLNANVAPSNKTRLEQIDERLAHISQSLGGMHECALGQRNRLRGAVPDRDTKTTGEAPKQGGMLGQIEDRLSWIEAMIGQIGVVHHDISSVL